MLKAELLTIVSSVKKQYQTFKIDTIDEKYGHKILRLPLYHCELNPIEQAWRLKGKWHPKTVLLRLKN